jgi:hypothetical protein
VARRTFSALVPVELLVIAVGADPSGPPTAARLRQTVVAEAPAEAENRCEQEDERHRPFDRAETACVEDQRCCGIQT